MEILTRTQMGADDDLDTVVIRLGELRPRVPYQIALEIEQNLRVSCKEAARFDRAGNRFWKDLVTEDPRLDVPKAHKGFRRSKLVPNVDTWTVAHKPLLVALLFDGVGKEMGYEDGIHLHTLIRKAGLRAKAWAGDTDSRSRMLGALHDAEADDKLGYA